MKESPWRINVARLTAAKELSLELGEEWFAHWVSEDPELEFTGPGQLTGVVHVEKHGKDVLVRGHLKGGLTLVCGRYLTSYEASLAADFDLLLAPGPGALKAEEELKAGPRRRAACSCSRATTRPRARRRSRTRASRPSCTARSRC